MLKIVIVALAALLTCAAAPLGSQEATPPANLRGFQFGIDPLVYATLKSDYVTGGRTVGGLGLQLRIGWGFTDHLSLAMDVSVSDLAVADSAKYLLANGDVLLRYTPRTVTVGGHVVAPYLGLGVNVRDVSADGRSPTGTTIYELAGEVLALSVGTSVYLRRDFALFAAYHAGLGDFNDERIGNTTTHNRRLRGDSHRLALGVTWHRGVGRR